MLGKKLINAGPVSSGANTFASENFNTVLYTGNGGTQRIGGYINRGAVFNGSSSYVAINDSPELRLAGTDYSISFWFNANNVGHLGRLINKDDATDFSGGYFVMLNTNATLTIGHNDGSNNQNWNPSNTFSANTWYHIVVTYSDSANLRTLYINGSSAATIATNTNIAASSDKLFFGTYGASSPGGQYFNGKLDQVRLFNKALSSSEVTTLYGETHASTTISTTDIFSDNSGVALYQLDGNANDTGGASGKFGEAAIFNGSSSRISNNDLDTASTKAVSLWANAEDFSERWPFQQGNGQGVENYIRFYNTDDIQVRWGNITQTFSGYSANTWYHIVMQTDASGNANVWINGTEVGTSTAPAALTEDRTNIGARYNNGYNSWFKGRVDDVRIYTDTLTDAEIGYLYNNTTASIPTDNLVAYYKLDGDARDEQQLYDGTATNVTYAYDGTATNVTYQEATKFQPDLVWLKSRSYANNHFLYDSVRGTTKAIYIQAEAEITRSGVTSFDSNGFTLGTSGDMNTSSATYVAWCFKGGGTAVSNTDGTLTSQVSANQAAGFSIVEYTSTGTNGSTVGTGLSTAADLVIIKSTNAASNWIVYNSVSGTGKYMYLNSSSGEQSASWFGTSATTFTLNNTYSDANTSGRDYIAYCFHSVDGYSKVGSYTGSSSEIFVETGFQPAFILLKATGISSSWLMYDNKRDNDYIFDTYLSPRNSNAEATNTAKIQVTSNGFIVPQSGIDTATNNGSSGYIYLAIAADPDTTTPTVENSFDVVTYIGNGSADHKINTDFKPDFVWIKDRGVSGANHVLSDSVRGAGKFVISNLTDSEYTSAGGTLSSFDEDGFTLAAASPAYDFNVNGNSYVAWCWKAGDHDDNLPQINTEGSIDSVVSVNADAGFSIVKYRGTASVGATVGHGLSSTPELYIIKETSAADDWMVVAKIGSSYQRGKLQTTDAFSTAMSGVTNNVDPTSTVITLGNSGSVNQSGQDYIGYFFHSVSGYQKIGSYTGNGGSQTISVGFQPRFVMIKRATGGSLNGWVLSDSQRGAGINLFANTSGAEIDESAYGPTSFTSDGFTLALGGGNTNAASSTYIYLAIK